MEKIKLFCLPYAGGSSMIYTQWKRYLNKEIELIPIELPGRGQRIFEPLLENLDEAVEDAYLSIIPQLGSSKVALFGYSMGSLIVYELAHKFKEVLKDQLIHTFFAARRAPHIENNHKNIHHLPQSEFENKLFELGGTPKEIFQDKELSSLFLPLLRSDFKMAETYKYVQKETKLSCDFTVLTGKDDDLTDKDIFEWKKHSSGKCTFYQFDGGHFFLNHQMEGITKVINNVLDIKNLAQKQSSWSLN